MAWANGLVCPPLYAMHRGTSQLHPGDINGNSGRLDEGEREPADLALGAYGRFTAHQLSVMTHSEGPWGLTG